MAFWDFLKEDNSIKTTQEHFDYFDNIRKENLQDIEDERNKFLLAVKIPDEFRKYIKWTNDGRLYLNIPFLEKPIVVEYDGDSSYFSYGFLGYYHNTFEKVMKYAIGTNEIKVK